MNTMHDDNTRQAVALGGMFLLITAALAVGKPSSASRSTTSAMAESWLQEVETGDDHIAATDLAREVLAAPADLALIDLRPADEFAQYHLPGAHNLTVPAVCGQAGRSLLVGKRMAVLYSNGPAHPGQAWVELRRQGHTNVKVLAGGLDEFKAQVLTPPSLREGATESGCKAELSRFALQRAFCLGDPRHNPLATWATDPAELTQPTMVSAQWLHQRLGKVAIVDVRGSAGDFAALHLPGAVHLPPTKLRARTGDRELFLLPAQQLAQQFGALGIGDTTPVVICAEDKMQDATLTAVALLHLGHRALAILEGGLLRWATERRPLVAAFAPPRPTTYTVRPDADDFSISTDDLAAQLGANAPAILDVRPPEFFRGEKSTEARPGHIPGALNRPFTKDLARTDDGHWLRPRAAVASEYAALGLAKDRPVVVHCRTGHTASETYFTLRYLLGYEKVRWYNGSWTEWAERKDLPAATGER